MLLDGTARRRTGLSWYKPARVQLLAAPDGESDVSPWSAIVMDGVAIPYDEVARVRLDESVLEFIFEHKLRSSTGQNRYRIEHTPESPCQHLRMLTRSDFNVWREALCPNITLQRASVGSRPLVVRAAQEWLKHAEGASTPCS